MAIDKKSTITIKDIAGELGISASTVSRALANSPLVKPETREAVQALAKKYNFQPNYTALSLRSNQTKTIGVIIPQIVHNFFSLVIRGIEDYSYSQGYSVIVSSSQEIYEREVMDSRTLLAGRVDGLLACISKETGNYDHLNEFVDRNIPLVLFDRAPEKVNATKVVIDDFQAAYLATSHLIEKECRKISYIGGPENLNIYKRRFEGFKAALKDQNVAFHPEIVVHCESEDFDECVDATAKVTGSTFDGLFATTDIMAIAAIKNIKKKGWKIPEDVAVIGFSNWPISSIYEPSVSTIDQPGYEMGRRSAQLLIEQIKDKENISIKKDILPVELIERESSKRA